MLTAVVIFSCITPTLLARQQVSSSFREPPSILTRKPVILSKLLLNHGQMSDRWSRFSPRLLRLATGSASVGNHNPDESAVALLLATGTSAHNLVSRCEFQSAIRSLLAGHRTPALQSRHWSHGKRAWHQYPRQGLRPDEWPRKFVAGQFHSEKCACDGLRFCV